jgi:hypothetical protein
MVRRAGEYAIGYPPDFLPGPQAAERAREEALGPDLAEKARQAAESARRGPYPSDLDELRDVFAYHPPKGDQVGAYEDVREIFQEAAAKLWELMPPGPGRAAAIRKLLEAQMSVNSAIAHEGRF